MWRKRGVVIFFFGDCDSFNGGRGVSEDNSVVKVFLFSTGESGNGCFSSVQIPRSVHKTVMDGKTVEQMRLSTSLNLD